MRLRRIFIAAGLALAPGIAMPQPIDWVRYQIPETGASVIFRLPYLARMQFLPAAKATLAVA